MSIRYAQRGQTLVEFTLTFLLFLLLMLGIIEFVHYTGAYVATVLAAREGARYGVRGGTNEDGTYFYCDTNGMEQRVRQVIGPFAQVDEIIIERPNECDDGTIPQPNAVVTIRVKTKVRPWVPLFPPVEAHFDFTARRHLLAQIQLEQQSSAP